MNVKTFDDWSIAHFIVAFIFGIIFLEGFAFPIFLLYALTIFFELFEHLLLGDLVFEWSKRERTEIPTNAIADIIIGIFGVFVASIMQTIL